MRVFRPLHDTNPIRTEGVRQLHRVPLRHRGVHHGLDQTNRTGMPDATATLESTFLEISRIYLI